MPERLGLFVIVRGIGLSRTAELGLVSLEILLDLGVFDAVY